MWIYIVVHEGNVVLHVANVNNDGKENDDREVIDGGKDVPVSENIKEGELFYINVVTVNKFIRKQSNEIFSLQDVQIT